MEEITFMLSFWLLLAIVATLAYTPVPLLSEVLLTTAQKSASFRSAAKKSPENLQ